MVEAEYFPRCLKSQDFLQNFNCFSRISMLAFGLFFAVVQNRLF